MSESDYSLVPDYSMDAGDDHVWARPVNNCPNCECCTTALCCTAKRERSSCFDLGGGNKDGYHSLDRCPCAPDTFGEQAAPDSAPNPSAVDRG